MARDAREYGARAHTLITVRSATWKLDRTHKARSKTRNENRGYVRILRGEPMRIAHSNARFLFSREATSPLCLSRISLRISSRILSLFVFVPRREMTANVHVRAHSHSRPNRNETRLLGFKHRGVNTNTTKRAALQPCRPIPTRAVLPRDRQATNRAPRSPSMATYVKPSVDSIGLE